MTKPNLNGMQASNCSHEFYNTLSSPPPFNHTLMWEYQTRSYQENSPPIISGRKICKKCGPVKIRERANQVSRLERPSPRKPSREGPIRKMLVQGAEKEPPVSPTRALGHCEKEAHQSSPACCLLLSSSRTDKSPSSTSTVQNPGKDRRGKKKKTPLRQVIYHIRSHPPNSRSGENPPTTQNPRTPTMTGSIPHIADHFPPRSPF